MDITKWKRMSLRLFICTSTIILILMYVHSCVSCNTRAPIIVGYFRYPDDGISTSMYNFTWQSLDCHPGSTTITRYEFEFVETCSTMPVAMHFTQDNQTTAVISLPFCESRTCRARVRTELSDNTFTDYSPCVLIKNQFFLQTRSIEQLNQDICVPIQRLCGQLLISDFFINGHLTLWPFSEHLPYNITTSQNTTFCFINITEDTVLTEYCYQSQSTSSSCPACVDFISYILILISRRTPMIQYTSSLITELSSSINIDQTRTTRESSYALSYSLESVSVYSSDVPTITLPQNIPNSHSLGILITVGAPSLAVLFIVTILAIIVGLWCHWKRQSESSCSLVQRKQENVYDEPSLPDPIYHEVQKIDSEAQIEMIGNLSYASVTVIADSELIACPAYVRHHLD